MGPAARDPDAAGPRARPSGRVLVAEDDPALRVLVAATLRSAGFDVEEAGDARRMERLLRFASRVAWPREPYDLVVTDVRMPEGGGLPVVEALRERGREIPVLVVTAFPDADVEGRCERLGAALLEKPVSLLRLRDVAVDLVSAWQTRWG